MMARQGRNRLRIGIDARNLSNPRPGGFRTYTVGLVSALANIDQHNQYILYYDREPSSGPDYLPANVGSEIVSAPVRLVQEQFLLPQRMRRDSLDVAFFPGNLLPVILPNCPTVVTIHDAIQMKPIVEVLRESRGGRQALVNLYFTMLASRSARKATLILTVSNHAKCDIVTRLGIPAAKVVVVYNGFDENLGPIDDPMAIAGTKQRYGIREDYFLYIGNLEPRKNLQRLLKAFNRLSGEYPVQLVLAGKKGWLYDDLFRQVRRFGLEGRVLFPGYIDEADKAPLLSGAAAYVFPSLYEGFGFPVLEAQACGTPLICANSSALPEVAGDGALLVDPEDVEGLSAAMTHVLSDAALRADLIARGRMNCRRFSWEECARKVLNVLETATGLDE